jgi:hypothetical protein
MIDIRVALAAAMLSVGSAAVVSAQQTTAPQGMRKDHPQRSDSARRMMGARGLRGQLFKGITLSDAEKANVKAVETKYASQMKALREQAKPQMQAARDARQKGDTAALRELWSKSAAQREQTKQLLVAERNELRGALTPANQATFDANVAQMEKRMADRGKELGKRGIRPPTKALR